MSILMRVVDHRKNRDARKRGVPARVGIERRDPHQPVHAGFGLQPAIGVVAADLDGGGLDAGFFALGLFQIFDLEAVLLGPARVHAQQHRGPVLALGAAGAGMDLEIGIEPVGLAADSSASSSRRATSFFRAFSAVSASATTPSSFSASPSSIMPTLSSSSRSTLPMPTANPPARSAPASVSALSAGSFQRLGSSASLFSSARRAVDASTSKMPPQQPDRLLDLFNEAFDFSAHGFSDLRREAAIARCCEGCSGGRRKAQSASTARRCRDA